MTRKWRPRPIVVAEPGPAINTTPLIDLMLVLLVMLILSIPMTTHRMPLDVPTGPGTATAPVHRLDIDAAGGLAWDGRPIGDGELRSRLVRMAHDPAEPVLHFAADGETRYERVDETLAVVLRAGVTRMGFVGNDGFMRTLDQPRP
jgi:biopolymer transport protein ExbD